MKHRKVLSLCLAAALTLLLFAGCGPSQPPAPAEASASAAGASASPASEQPSTESGTPEDGPFTPYAEPLKITTVLAYRPAESEKAPESITPETQAYITLFKEQLNIELEYLWIVNSDQFRERLGAQIASGSIPDVLFLEDKDKALYYDLAEQGGFADLRGSFEKYASEGTKLYFQQGVDTIETVTGSKELYTLPNGGGDSSWNGGQMYYRQDWLDQVGLGIPTTIAELEAVMEAFDNSNLGGHVKGEPIMPANGKYYFWAEFADFTPFFAGYGTWLSNNLWIDDGTGTVYNPLTSENTKAALGKLAEWYQKGYIAKDFASIDVWAADAKCVADTVAGKFGIVPGSWWVPNWPLNEQKMLEPEAQWVVGKIPTPDGSPSTIYKINNDFSGYNSVSAKFSNPEALIKMMNVYIEASSNAYNPLLADSDPMKGWGEWENGYVYHWLPFRCYYGDTLKDNQALASKLITEGRDMPTDEEVPYNSEFWQIWDAVKAYQANPDDGMAWGFYYSRVDPNAGIGLDFKVKDTHPFKRNVLTEALPVISEYSSALDDLRNQVFLEIIMGQRPLSDFDKFVDDWNALGGNAIRDAVQEWYNARK